MTKGNCFKKGVHDGIPIGLGYFAVSFAFGMMAVSGGLRIWDAVLISLTNLTSAGQFAGLGIIVSAGSLMEMALTQLTINLRYCLMSFSLSQKLDPAAPWYHRFFVAFGVTDEIFGVSASQEGKISPFYSYGLMSMAIPGWTLGTLLGAVSGDLLPDYIVSALSIAIYGMFIAVFIPPAKKSRPVLITVLAAMGLSCLFRYAPLLDQVSLGFSIILTTVVVSTVMALLFPIQEEPEPINKGEDAGSIDQNPQADKRSGAVPSEKESEAGLAKGLSKNLNEGQKASRKESL